MGIQHSVNMDSLPAFSRFERAIMWFFESLGYRVVGTSQFCSYSGFFLRITKPSSTGESEMSAGGKGSGRGGKCACERGGNSKRIGI